MQETTKKAKENARLTRLCEDIIEKVNKILAFKIPTRIYTLYNLKYKYHKFCIECCVSQIKTNFPKTCKFYGLDF